MKEKKERLLKQIAEKEATIREIKEKDEHRAFKLFEEVATMKDEITVINKFNKFK